MPPGALSPRGASRRRRRSVRAGGPAALILAALLGALAATVCPGAARADELLERKVGLTAATATTRTLFVSVGLQDLFTPAARERLTSGFATRVLVRVQLLRHGETEPLAVGFQRVEIVYDIWDEKFRLRITRGVGPDTVVEVKTVAEAIDRACRLWHFPVADLTLLQPNVRYFLAFRADLNPISEELLADVRRWLVQPSRGQRRVGAGDSVFGSFVSIFVNPRIEDS
jgi:hypothetical protein